MDQPFQATEAKRVLPGWSLGIRAIEPDDKDEIVWFLQEHWGSHQIVTRGRVLDASSLPGFIAPSPAGDLNGLITLSVDDRGCEIVTMNSVHRGRGVGTNLMSCAEIFAEEHGAGRLWLVTTNDNVEAMAFYMRRQFRMLTVYRDAVDEARKKKPSIPSIGRHGIEVHDEVEFEKLLGAPARRR